MKLSTEEFVEMFGSDVQIKKYQTKKKLEKKTRDSLIKLAESVYEKVDIIKEGRNNVYVVEDKRDIALEKRTAEQQTEI